MVEPAEGPQTPGTARGEKETPTSNTVEVVAGGLSLLCAVIDKFFS